MGSEAWIGLFFMVLIWGTILKHKINQLASENRKMQKRELYHISKIESLSRKLMRIKRIYHEKEKGQS